MGDFDECTVKAVEDQNIEQLISQLYEYNDNIRSLMAKRTQLTLKLSKKLEQRSNEFEKLQVDFRNLTDGTEPGPKDY